MFDVPAILATTMLTFLLAGAVKGMIGLGLPTVAVGLLGLVMAPAQAAALLVVPSLMTNVWQLAAGPRFMPLMHRLWPMMAGICVGTGAGSGLLAADASGRATMALGIALILYAAASLVSGHLRVPPGAESWLSPIVGVATGVVTAATGVLVIPAVPYLQALALEKDDLVQALGLSFTVSTVALAASLAHEGLFQASLAGLSLLALAPAVLGMALGQRLRRHLHPARFRLLFFLGLLAVGLHLAIRPLL